MPFVKAQPTNGAPPVKTRRPLGRKLSRRQRWLLGVACALSLMAAFGLFAWRPAPILGVKGGALARSVLGGILTPPCERLPGDLWRCDLFVGLYDEQPNAVYRVEVDPSAAGRRSIPGLAPTAIPPERPVV
jgi:hypothetical protein